MNGRSSLVVVADSDAKERSLTANALRRGGYQTIEVETGLEALEAVREMGVGLVMLEVLMPGISGYEVCRELRQEHGEGLAIFFLSGTRTDALDRVVGLLLGADDFIVKPFDSNELNARVGRFVSRHSVTERIGSQIVELGLTPREGEVLNHLALGQSQKEIARDLTISAKTVGTHIQNLLVKFEVHSRAELVASAYRGGYVSELADRRIGTVSEPGRETVSSA